MSGYPLLSLQPLLLEKVISKMEVHSYFLLQQTCKILEQFIQNCTNIAIPLDITIKCFIYEERVIREFRSKYWEAEWAVMNKDNTATKFCIRSFKGLRGIRIGLLDMSAGSSSDRRQFSFHEVCNFIKNLRISCTELWTQERTWTSEETLTLMDILKPTKITLFSRKSSSRYEVILQSKTLKEISRLFIDELSADIATEKLLPKFGNMMIAVSNSKPRLVDPFPVLRRVLHLLFSRTWPSLQNYKLDVIIENRVAFSADELKEELKDFKLVVNPKRRRNPSSIIELPPHYPKGSKCCLRIERVVNPFCLTHKFYRLLLAVKIPTI